MQNRYSEKTVVKTAFAIGVVVLAVIIATAKCVHNHKVIDAVTQ